MLKIFVHILKKVLLTNASRTLVKEIKNEIFALKT